MDTHKMNVTHEFPPDFVACDASIQAFGHEWHCAIPPTDYDSATSLPAPFNAFGGSAQWKLLRCSMQCKKPCHQVTLELARQHANQQQAFLSQQAVLMGITRNKKIASAYRLRKAKEKAMAEESEDEEDIVVVSESESSQSESSESSESESSEEDVQDDQEDDVEEEEEEDESDND